MLVPLDLKTLLVRKSCISPSFAFVLMFSSSSFCLFASESCILHHYKETSALLIVDSIFQELKHQEKTKEKIVSCFGSWIVPQGIEEAHKIVFASPNSRNPSARIHKHTLQSRTIWEGCIHECRLLTAVRCSCSIKSWWYDFLYRAFCCTSFT